MICDKIELESKIKAILNCINLLADFELKDNFKDLKKTSIEQDNALLDFYVDILIEILKQLKEKIGN